MRKLSGGEKLIVGGGLTLAVALGGCASKGSSGEASDTTTTASSSTAMYPQIPGKIFHTEDQRGIPVGVRTYVSPFSNEQQGSRSEGAGVNVVCVEPDGRDLVDTNVPAGQPQERGNDWYLITATPDVANQEWVNTSYVDVGSAAVADCATIEGLDPTR